MVNDVWHLSTLLFSIPFITTGDCSPDMIFNFFFFFPLPRTDYKCVRAFEHINYLLMLTLSLFSLTQPGSAQCLHRQAVATATDGTSPSQSAEFASEILESNMKQGNAGTKWIQVLVSIDQFNAQVTWGGGGSQPPRSWYVVQHFDVMSELSRVLTYWYCEVHALRHTSQPNMYPLHQQRYHLRSFKIRKNVNNSVALKRLKAMKSISLALQNDVQ